MYVEFSKNSIVTIFIEEQEYRIIISKKEA